MSWEDWFDDFLRSWRRFLRSRFFDFEEMDKWFEEMLKETMGEVPKELVREKKLPDGSVTREIGPLVYGYSVTIGPDGKPEIREFGNIRPGLKTLGPGVTKPAVSIKGSREPLTDVIEEQDAIKVIAELPGVEKTDINLRISERKLTISAETPRRKYHKVVDLPADVDPKSSKATFKNGILEVTLKRVGGVTEGQPISVE
jgi:HSP20 family protein